MGNRLCPCGGSVGVPRVSEGGVIQLEGSLCGEKKEKKLEFWTVWKERNKLDFKGGVLNIQKLKNSFACTLWSWGVYWRGVLFTLRFFGVASGHLREGKGACFFVLSF